MASSVEDVRRAIEAARAQGNEDDASALEQYLSQLQSPTGEGLSGPALNLQQRENRIGQYEQEYRDITVPKNRGGGFMGATANEVLSEISGEPEDVFEDREVQQPLIDPFGRAGQTATQLEVGVKGIAQRYFQRKDDAIDARKALWDTIYSQLPEQEKKRLSNKPKHWGWEYDDFRNMPFLDLIQYIEKGGMVTREDIKGILGEEQYTQLLKGEHPTQEGAGMLYEYLVQPLLTSEEGLKPSAQLALSMEQAQKNWLTDETRQSLAKPWTAEDATWYKPWSWFDETTKAPWEDFDGFYYSVMENVPNLVAAFAGARGGGRLAAGFAKAKKFDSIEDAARAQQKLAGVGGAAGGGATEALLIRDATYQETAQRVRDLPQETWDQYPEYQAMVENGVTPEHAKQILSFEVGKKAGDVAAVASGLLLGSPMGWWFGQRAAGRISKEGIFRSMIKGTVGEAAQEGAQGTTEQLVSNLNVQRIDPNQDITEGLLEAGVGEAMSTIGPGALMGALSTGGAEPAGLTKADQRAAGAVKSIKDAINARYKFEQELTAAEEDVSQMPVQERIDNFRKFEELQEAESNAILENAKTLRKYMKDNPSAVDSKMLDRLEMKANATLSNIEAARSKRTTLAKQLIEEQDLYRERENIEQKVQSNLMKLDDVERQLEAIRAVQNQEQIDSNMYDELRREGYGAWVGPNEDRFIIRPRGIRAAKELARQARDLRKRIEAGYTGGERRKNDRRRQAIEMMTPQAREKFLHTDSLTGVKTRRAFNERVQNIDERDPDKRGESKARVVAAVDVDSLKWVNDNMGMASGDRLLMAVADELNQQGVDVYRLGGDEFAVTGYSPEQVETVLQRAAQKLESREIGDEERSVTPQITWALGSNWEEASAAEQRMKRDRIAKGKTAARKGQPATYRVKKQLPLFQLEGVPPRRGGAPSQWLARAVKNNDVKVGDQVQITVRKRLGRREGQPQYTDVINGTVAQLDKFPANSDAIIRIDTEGNGRLYFNKNNHLTEKGSIENDPGDNQGVNTKLKVIRSPGRRGRGYKQTSAAVKISAVAAEVEARIEDIRFQGGRSQNPYDLDVKNTYTVRDQKSGQAASFSFIPISRDRILIERDAPKYLGQQAEATLTTSIDVTEWARQELPEQTIVELAVNEAYGWNARYEGRSPRTTRLDQDFFDQVRFQGGRPWKMGGKKGDLYIRRHGKAAGDVVTERVSDNDIAITFDKDVLLTDYMRYTFNYLKPQFQARLRGMQQQFISQQDIDEVLTQHFTRMANRRYEGDYLPNKYREISDIVERGDVVEILTPEGAIFGTITAVKGGKRPRWFVTADGRDYVFNPVRNWLIVRPETDPADIEYLVGDDYIQDGPTIREVQIGHVGNDFGEWYADIGDYGQQAMFPDPYDNWWETDYPEWSKTVPFLPEIGTASQEEMTEATRVVMSMVNDYNNLPPINIVGSLEELESVAPETVAEARAQGYSLRGIRGWFDETRPDVGIVIIIPNIPGKPGSYTWEMNIKETVMHEMIGHYGVRGLFGNDIDLRHEMLKIYHAPEFEKVRNHIRAKVKRPAGMNETEYRQLVGEEMIAYITGEVLSGKLNPNKKQKSLLRRFFDWVRSWFRKKGYSRSYSTLEDAKREFWNDTRVMELFARASDYVRNGKNFEYTYRDGRQVKFIRDGEIFRMGITSAVDNWMQPLSKNQRKQLASKYGGIENVPKEVPLFPEEGSAQQYEQIIAKLKKDGKIKSKELELTYLDPDGEWYFFRDATYQDMWQFTKRSDHDITWYKGIVPKAIEKELDELMQYDFIGPREHPQPWRHWASYSGRITEIMNTVVDPKQTRFTKDMLLRFLESQKVVQVYVKPKGGHQGNEYDVARRLGLGDFDDLNSEQRAIVRAEVEVVRKLGYDVGYDPDQDRWFNRVISGQSHAQLLPQGIDASEGKYEVVFLKQEGGGLEVGSHGHFGGERGVLAHMRIGVADLVGVDMPAPNPDWNNKAVALGELQTDWLTSARRSFPTTEDRDRAERERTMLVKALGQTTRDIAMTMRAHALNEVKTKLLPAANLPQGSLQTEFENRLRNRYGPEPTDEQRRSIYLEVRNEQVQNVIQDVQTAKELIESYTTMEGALGDVPGSFDARVYERLDRFAMRKLGLVLHHDLGNVITRLESMTTAGTQEVFVQRLNEMMEAESLFNRTTRWAQSSAANQPQIRIAFAKSQLNELTDRFYDGLNMPESAKEEVRRIANQSRSHSLFKVNQDLIDKANAAMGNEFFNTNGQDMVNRIFSPENLAEYGISPEEISLEKRYEYQTRTYDIDVWGSESGIAKFRDAIGQMVSDYIRYTGPTAYADNQEAMVNRRNVGRTLSRDITEPDWQTIVDEWGLEDHEEAIGQEGDTETEAFDIQSFYDYEENRIGEVLDEIIDEAFNEMDWDGVYNEDGEGLWPGSHDYQSHVTFDDDGDAYTDDARAWLRDARENYRNREMQEDDTYREQAYDQLRDEFYSDAPMLIEGQMPIEWDADGEATEWVQLAVVQSEVDGYTRIYIDREDVSIDYSSKRTAFESVPETIREWYEEHDIALPPGVLFGPAEAPAPRREPSALQELTGLDETMPQFTTLGQQAAASIGEVQGKAQTVDRMFERVVEVDKALTEGYVGVPSSPIANDRYWRTMALKYLIADAVRKGAPGIVWHGGMANTIRGGRYVGQEAVKYLERIKWTAETVELAGKEQEVLVIRGVNMAPMVVAKQYAIGALGSDLLAHISKQRSGEIPAFPSVTDSDGNRRNLTMDDFLVSTTGDIHFIYRRDNHDLVGFTRDEAEIEGLMQNAIAQDEEASAAVDLVRGDVDPGAATTRPIRVEPIGEVIASGEVSSREFGGPIQLIVGRQTQDYRTYFKVPLLAGARESYERITPQIWEKELRKYGGKIEKINVAIGSEEAARKEGGRLKYFGDERERRIAEIHGEVKVVELTGETHGWMAYSATEGPLSNELFTDRLEAEQWLREWKQDNYGGEQKGIEINFIRINDKMRDEFSGPVPPFHYDPEQDPAMEGVNKKIGFEKKTLRERVAKIRSMAQGEFQQGMFDRMYGIKRALTQTQGDTGPYVSARLTTSLDSQMKAVLEYGHPVWRDGIMRTEGEGLLEILKPVANRIDLWGRYMVGRRAQRLKQEDREKLFTDDEINAMIKLGEKYPVFERVADDYAEFNKKVLDFAEASGVIDADTRPLWENADYIPFYRVQDERLMGPLAGSAGIAGQAKPIRRLRGGETNIGDPIHNIMINLTKLLDSSVKNNASLEVIDELMNTGMVAKVGYDMAAQMIPMSQVKKILIDKGMDPATIPADAMKGLQKMFAITPPKGDGIIPVLRNGKREFYQTDDMLLWRAMLNINKQQFGQWMRLFRAPKRFLTTMITLDPGFMVANFVRDSMSAFVLSRDQFVPVASALKGFGKALVKDKDMRTMLSAGAAFESGYINQYDPNATRRLIKTHMKDKTFARTVMNTPQKLLEGWKAIGSATENANRMAVYQAAIRAGKSKKQAVYEAKDLMDFSMGGDWPVIQFLIQTVPFMGARMQGLHRLGRGAVEHPVAFTIKGLLLSMAGMALWFAFRDDERYKELEEWDKDTYFHWWIGDNHYRLPKGFEVGAIFNTIPERIFEYLYSQENDAGKLLLKRFGFMIAETFNMNPVPQVVAPGVEMQFNHNFFTGRYIVSPYQQQRLPPEQYRYSTSPTMVELARQLPAPLDAASTKVRSPLHLQNLYHGYTGTLGNYVLMGSDWLIRRYMDYPLPPTMDISRYPLYGRFVRGQAPRPTKYQEEFYRLMDKTNMVQGSLTFLENTEQGQRLEKIIEEYEPYVRVADSLESIRQDVSDINRAQQQIYMNIDMTPDEKKREIDMLEEQKQILFKEGYQMRPGGALNPNRPVTQEDVIGLIERWGVDDSIAYQRTLEENAPSTQELLEMIEDNMERRQLESLAKIARN